MKFHIRKMLFLPLLVGGIVLLAVGFYRVQHHSNNKTQLAAVTRLANLPSPRYNFVGPGCMMEFGGRFSLYLDPGWFADTSEFSTSLRNYDNSKIRYDHGKALNLPDGAIKAEMYVDQLESGQTARKWLVQSVRPNVGSDVYELTGQIFGKMQWLDWKSPSENHHVLVVQPDQDSRMIVVDIWDAPESWESQLQVILGSLQSPADCIGQFDLGPPPKVSALPYPLPAISPEVIPYPYPGPEYPINP